MKKLTLLIVLTMFSLTINAQSGRFSAGADLGLPVGDYADFNSLGLGISARYEYSLADKLSLTFTAGYQSFAGKEYTIDILGVTTTVKPDPTTIIPVQVGGKYYFKEAWNGLYASADLGLHLFSGEGESESKFGYAPGIGYCVTKNIDLGLRYQMIPFEGGFSFDYLRLRAAYVFGGK